MDRPLVPLECLGIPIQSGDALPGSGPPAPKRIAHSRSTERIESDGGVTHGQLSGKYSSASIGACALRVAMVSVTPIWQLLIFPVVPVY